MKKLLITILLVLLSIPAFSIGFEADVYFGGSNGADVGVVFGSGKITHSVGVIFENHEYEREKQHYSAYNYSTSTEIEKGVANDFGAYYKFDYATDFVNLGKIKIGMDIGSLFAATNESVFLFAVMPSAKVSVSKFDIIAGYRGTLYADMFKEYKSSPFTSAFSIGVKYKFKSQNTSKVLDYIDTSSNPLVIKHDKIY